MVKIRIKRKKTKQAQSYIDDVAKEDKKKSFRKKIKSVDKRIGKVKSFKKKFFEGKSGKASKRERGEVKRRAKAVGGIAAAMGLTRSKQTKKGAGRPSGTYKYGMPIQVYKKE